MRRWWHRGGCASAPAPSAGRRPRTRSGAGHDRERRPDRGDCPRPVSQSTRIRCRRGWSSAGEAGVDPARALAAAELECGRPGGSTTDESRQVVDQAEVLGVEGHDALRRVAVPDPARASRRTRGGSVLAWLSSSAFCALFSASRGGGDRWVERDCEHRPLLGRGCARSRAARAAHRRPAGRTGRPSARAISPSSQIPPSRTTMRRVEPRSRWVRFVRRRRDHRRCGHATPCSCS